MKRTRLSRKLFAIIAVVIFSTTTSAQTPAVPTADRNATLAPTQGHCRITTVYLKGNQDNFGGGPDPTQPSPALASFLSTLNPGTYDVNVPNKNFGDSFRLCSCETCGAKLEIRVRKTTQQDIPSNDGYTIGIAPFNPATQRVAQGTIWTNNGPEPPKTLTINLPANKLNEVLCKSKAQWLDVYLQDDTVVDWMRLTITHP